MMNAWEHARVREQILFQSYDWISGLIARSDLALFHLIKTYIIIEEIFIHFYKQCLVNDHISEASGWQCLKINCGYN